ncbi:hypothetical protein BFW38_00600 [Terasakiispira papahanaumokuakeensis]|uniref:CobW C-terminal domain-containing protein n=2 Tax=Terasakiispira papahanaumokuakeensis TaxID=197479 RepID=A0A1E2VE32_9GAMM|nr:hypothetical protein BFW38_00600 [Terasakiispira papahanaumokuakeensis]
MSTAMPANRALIPVTLLTGFLGSGKTTLLNQWLQQPDMAETLVIINEFGERALDHRLVAHSQENVVKTLDNGCMCCNIRGDLVQTLRNSVWRFARGGQRQFKQVIIETTGLADPAPIIQTLTTHPQLLKHFRLSHVLTTVDLIHGLHTLQEHPQAQRQMMMADTLLLTKSDQAQDGQYEALRSQLIALNPAASQYLCPLNTEIQVAWTEPTQRSDPSLNAFQPVQAFQPMNSFQPVALGHSMPSSSQASHQHGDDLYTFGLTLEAPVTQAQLNQWIEQMKALAGPRLLRFKGLFNVAGCEQPVVVHGVQHVISPPQTLPTWPDDDRRSSLTWITHQLPQSEVFAALSLPMPSSD